MAYDAVLRGDKIITLSNARNRLCVFVAKPSLDKAAPPPDPIPYANPEDAVLQKTIPLEFKASLIAVDEEARFCAVLYPRPGCPAGREPPATETIDIICLVTGTLALLGLQARLLLEHEDGGMYSRSQIVRLELMGDYIAVLRGDEWSDVHRWRPVSSEPELHFPIVCSTPEGEGTEGLRGLSLLAPNYAALISLPHLPLRNSPFYLDLHRLVGAHSIHLARFAMPDSDRDGDGPE